MCRSPKISYQLFVILRAGWRSSAGNGCPFHPVPYVKAHSRPEKLLLYLRPMQKCDNINQLTKYCPFLTFKLSSLRWLLHLPNRRPNLVFTPRNKIFPRGLLRIAVCPMHDLPSADGTALSNHASDPEYLIYSIYLLESRTGKLLSFCPENPIRSIKEQYGKWC